jgi:hypothetical protein
MQTYSGEYMLPIPTKRSFDEEHNLLTPIKANQKRTVYVTKIHHQDSVMTYREFKKGDKIIMEFATRVSDTSMRSLLLHLLNLFQDEVREVQNDPANQDLIKKFRSDRDLRKVVEALAADKKVVPDPLDLGQDEEDEDDLAARTERDLPKRNRKPVKRFTHDDFNAKGEYRPQAEESAITYGTDDQGSEDDDDEAESLYHDDVEPEEEEDRDYVPGAKQVEKETSLSHKHDRQRARRLMLSEKQEREEI